MIGLFEEETFTLFLRVGPDQKIMKCPDLFAKSQNSSLHRSRSRDFNFYQSQLLQSFILAVKGTLAGFCAWPKADTAKQNSSSRPKR